MSASTTTATVDHRSPSEVLVDDLKAFGAHPDRKLPPVGSEWEQAEWDRLSELAAGAH
jgi:hypothetical protein